MSSPIEELGKLMDGQMKHVMRANQGITLELGVIGENLSLSVASLGNAIPKGDYMVSLHLIDNHMQLDTSYIALSTSQNDAHSHTIGQHNHAVILPARLCGLKEGDRVLVAWVGTEPVVVDIVVSS